MMRKRSNEEVILTPATLGETLYAARKLKRLSLKAAAGPAEISATYLQKLERGEVQEPSPHVLYRLGHQLDLPYGELMSLAGYVVPSRAGRPPRGGSGPLTHALSSEPLTDDEAQALAEYLAFLRQRQTGD